MRNFKKGNMRVITSNLIYLGLKDHVISEKRLSSNPPGGPPTQLARLSRRKPEDEELVTEENYLHPKKPPSRMSMLYLLKIILICVAIE